MSLEFSRQIQFITKPHAATSVDWISALDGSKISRVTLIGWLILDKKRGRDLHIQLLVLYHSAHFRN